MVDNSGEYVLQWEGHACHVTERFSGLFARQSLVDVTLICEEQRLRVHKLVLASCSLYFEEMLEQDLGQEPTILLNDLNFEVLKAMVEFMYCGETCVSEEHLEPLLHAARVFKVKELAFIAENMMGPPIAAAEQVRNFSELTTENADDLEDGNDYSLFSDHGKDEISASEIDENYDTNSESPKEFQAPLSLAEIAHRNVMKFYKKVPSCVFNNENNELPLEIYEQCCDFVNTEKESNECILASVREEKSSIEFNEVNRTLDKCLKVYTHKRRKSVEGVEKTLVKVTGDLPEEPEIINNCIDLIDEPSKNETELENNYILSLSNENVENSVDFGSSEAPLNLNKESRQMKEIFSSDNRIISSEKSNTQIYKSNSLRVPVLRRSVRLNHQENEDSTNNNNNNNNNSIQEIDPQRKDMRRESFRRKTKRSDLYCESDENEVSQNSITKCLDRARSLRSNSSKLMNRRRGDEKPSNRTSNGDSFSNKFNTIASVSRALWGDMSDCLENSENNIDLSDYSPSKEIPFAVGLLPLRAALERMQATPDYQPRKTRSSVTPFKQEFFKGVKRKTMSNDNNVLDTNNYKAKRQSSRSSHGDNNLPGDTVCHVRITTSHSEPVVRTRRGLITEQVDSAAATAAISTANIVNRQ